MHHTATPNVEDYCCAPPASPTCGRTAVSTSGRSRPLLVTVRGADQEEVALAVRALTPDGAVRASALPGRDEWKRLLSAAERRP